MAAGRLPDKPNIDHLKNQAKTLQQFVRAGVNEAIALVNEFHPRPGATFSRADAQLVVARQYGFASWRRLKDHVEIVNRYARAPQHQPPTGDPADEFLLLACLTHGGDDPARWRHAAELLTDHPELATANIHTAAAVGDVAAARSVLARDPAAANRDGGPHDWAPLLYLAYSTIDDRQPGRSHLETARLLLDAGADPAAGYLWEGLCPPYTALTGALTSPHSEPVALARLLLERGANANDGQALYELGFVGDDPEPLALLFEFGLGTGDGGVWHARLAPRHDTPTQLVEDELIRAAAANLPRRARVVLDHGVDLNGRGSNHRIFEGLSAYELAVLHGSVDVAALLEAAGARSGDDDVLDFLGACIRADRPVIERLRAADPTVVARAIERRPQQVSVAADDDRVDAVMLMVELGFDVNAPGGYPYQQTALHGAAFNGNLALVRYLVAHGADLSAEDCSFHATALGWADHNGQRHVVEYLAAQPGVANPAS